MRASTVRRTGRPLRLHPLRLAIPDAPAQCDAGLRLVDESAAHGPDSSRVTQGFLFPRETASRTDFVANLQGYLKRWHMAVVEDNNISLNQQRASESPHHRPGPPYHSLEFAGHKFDNMVLDAVLAGEAAAAVERASFAVAAAAPPARPSMFEEHLRLAASRKGLAVAATTNTLRPPRPV